MYGTKDRPHTWGQNIQERSCFSFFLPIEESSIDAFLVLVSTSLDSQDLYRLVLRGHLVIAILWGCLKEGAARPVFSFFKLFAANIQPLQIGAV